MTEVNTDIKLIIAMFEEVVKAFKKRLRDSKKPYKRPLSTIYKVLKADLKSKDCPFWNAQGW